MFQGFASVYLGRRTDYTLGVSMSWAWHEYGPRTELAAATDCRPCSWR